MAQSSIFGHPKAVKNSAGLTISEFKKWHLGSILPIKNEFL